MFNPAIVTVETVLAGNATPKQLFSLGIMYSTGQSMPLDLVSAHKWFNIAAMFGMKDAVRLRNEVAAEMTDAEIVAAQRAARDWLKKRH